MWRGIVDVLKTSPVALQLADRLGRGAGRVGVLQETIPPAPHRPDVRLFAGDADDSGLAVTCLGHATCLIRMGGVTLLSDPVFSSRVGVSVGMTAIGPRRLMRPALQIDELPRIDALLLTHAHFDHLDRPSLLRLFAEPKATRELEDRRRPPAVVPPGVRDLVQDLGYRPRTLRLGASLRIGRVTITAVPVKHWGARVFFDSRRGYCAYLLEADGRRVLLASDSAFHDGYRAVAPVDLALPGISAYDPYVAAHATPEQVAEMMRFARARAVMPIHHKTFRLSHEQIDEPLRRLKAALPDVPVVAPEVGQVYQAGGPAA
ncbi:MAG: MBL fold metallo-hydrolase [Phycisphaerae bacterium]